MKCEQCTENEVCWVNGIKSILCSKCLRYKTNPQRLSQGQRMDRAYVMVMARRWRRENCEEGYEI